LDAFKKKIEMPYLTKEKRAGFFADFGGKTANTGSIEGQIALLTERINRISEHLQANKKDFSTHRGLMQLVGKRKRLLTYLSKHNLQDYRKLIEKIGLRK
jgi:small subunit ribosomal protein S15